MHACYTFAAVIERENTYQTIKRMKTSSDWDFCLAHFQKAWTLDFYFRLYELVLTYYPERKYGYAKEMARNDLIISKLGGGIRRLCKILTSSNPLPSIKPSF